MRADPNKFSESKPLVGTLKDSERQNQTLLSPDKKSPNIPSIASNFLYHFFSLSTVTIKRDPILTELKKQPIR